MNGLHYKNIKIKGECFMEHKLNEKYCPADFEEKLYEKWEKRGYFKPSMNEDEGRSKFT